MKAYRTVLISAVVYSVVIGLIYIALSVLAILARNCQLDMTGHPLIYMMFQLYFRVRECEANINWSLLGITSQEIAVLPDETQAAHRTFIFAIVYLGLYAVLIFTALFSLFGINNSCLGRRSFPIFFAPWIVVCCAVIVMDVLATVYYIMDLISTTSTSGLMELLEVQNPAAVAGAFDQLAARWRFLPPVIMFLTTAKCFVFFIMDLVIISLIARAGWAASTYHKYVEDTIRQYSSPMSRANPAFEESQVDILAQKQHNRQLEYMNDQSSIQEVPPRVSAGAVAPPETPDRYNDTTIQPFVYPSRNFYDNEQDSNQHSIPRPTTLALLSKLNQQPQHQNDNGQQRNNDREIEARLSHYTTSDGNVIRSVEPLKDESISEKQQQQTRVRVLPAVIEINRNSSEIKVKQRPPVPPKPHNPNRVSTQPSAYEERPVERSDSRNSAAKVDRTSSMNNELRGQLPWSYFKARDDVPKKSFQELDEDEDLPPVPIPDYTLHFPKTKRTNLNDSDGDGSWNRYDQRY